MIFLKFVFWPSDSSIKAAELLSLSLLDLQLAVRHGLFTLETKVSLLTHTMEFEYGKIESFEEFKKPFITLSISQNIAYDTKIRKFNVFNVEGLQNGRITEWNKC